MKYDIDIHVPTNHMDTIVIGVTSDEMISIGWKRFKSIGHFKYEWCFQMDHDEVAELYQCLRYALELTTDNPEDLPS